jgi:predicted transglutaminase-like cysteine proteinase
MSAFIPARGVVGWCVLALLCFAGAANALPVSESDMAQFVIDIAPDVANISVSVAAIDPAPATAAAPPPAEPFGLGTTSVAAGPLWNKWSGVVEDIRAERDVLARCRATAATCPPAAARFLAVVESGRTRAGRARLGEINRAVNLAIRPMSDLAQYGVEDRWTSPLATFTTGAGDCEDYAIAKYVALQAAGMAESDVRLVIVRDTAVQEDHAVVAAYVDGRWVVLDNRRLTLVADTDMRGTVPLFVLDHEGVRRFEPAAAPVAALRRPSPANGASPATAVAGL